MNKDGFDAQKELWDSFEAKDIKRFSNAINLGAQPNLTSKDDVNNMSIYEKVLSKSGSAKYIRTCIDAGCDVNYINPQLNKAAINYVAKSKSPKNLSMLLHQPSCKVNVDHQFEGETPLNTLCKSLRSKNIGRVSNCIRLLLNQGASPNLTDNKGKTPLQHVLQMEEIPIDQRCNLIIEFLKLPDLSIQYYREGLNYLIQHYLDGRNYILYNLLVRQLLSLKTDQVLGMFAEYQKTIAGWDNRIMQNILLNEHMKNNIEHALNAVIVTLKLTTPKDNEKLVELAIEAGNWQTVLALLKSDSIKDQQNSNPLKIMIKQAQLQPLLNREYENCLLQMLKDQENCVNQCDEQNNTPLHYAVLYRNEIAIKELLRQGARLGRSCGKNRLPIEDIDVKLLEEHFDYCITTRGEKPSHEEYEIIMNCLNLTNRQNELDITPIVYMAKSKELCPLLQHPLITCFLLLKWQRLSTIFYTHFLIYILFSLSLVVHVILRFPQRLQFELPIQIVTIIFSSLIVYMLIVELLTYLMANQFPSCLDPPLVALLILTCSEWGDNPETQKIVSVFAIMLMAIKLTNLIGELPVPSISTHMLMLRQVTSNFLMCLAQYSIFVFTFGLCFFVLFGKSENATSNFLSYSDPDRTFMKTLVMFIGEYNDDDFNNFYSSLVLIIFMFMTMILTNLLGGLAVSDTQTIQAQVELNAAICRTKLLNNYEGILKEHWEYCEWLRRIFQKLMNIHTDCSYGYLSIYPNQENRAEVYKQRHRNQSLESLANLDDNYPASLNPDHEDGASSNNSDMGSNENLTNFDAEMNAFEIKSTYKSVPNDLNALNTDLQIDNETVKRALQIIKQKSNTEIEEQREELSEKRLEDIWNLLKEIKSELISIKSDK